jgi:putative transposase
MKIIRGFKTELDLNDRQRTACLKHAGAARFAYNFALQRKEEARRAGKKIPTAMELHRELNGRKKDDLAWLYEVSKCAPQEALRDADRAFENHYRRVQARKAGTLKGKVGYPRFKSRKRRIGSFRLTGTIRVFERHIQLPRLGRLRLHERGYLPLISTLQKSGDADILSVTVSEHAGRWYVSVQVEMEVLDPAPATGPAIGVDLGIRTLATCSDGRTFANPRALEHTQKSLRRAQRSLARRKKGSKNREKARRKVAQLYARVTNLRDNALHQATARIVARTKPASERPAVVVLEDLNVAGMVKNRRLARAISDVGMGEFRRQVMYKAAWAGVRVLIAPRFFPSSKRCSVCHHHKDTLRLSETTYVCEACGMVMDRDLNAACNLEQLVLSSA